MRSRSVLLIVTAVAALAPSALAGIGTPAARLELRIVPQRGVPADAAGVVDVAGSQHDAITSPGAVRRFEIQYRVIDQLTADGITPSGLRSAQLRIDAAGAGLGAATLRRAALSRFEAELAAAAGPVTPDLSGLPVGPALTGLHRPFRDGLGVPGNDDAGNGAFERTPAAASLVAIIPFAAAATSQNLPDTWYGLYSFDLVATDLAPGLISLTVTPVADAVSGSRFSFWAAGQTAPRFSPAATSVTATVFSQIPAPTTAALLALFAVATPKRRRPKH